MWVSAEGQRASATGKNYVLTAQAMEVVLVVLMKEEILRLNNCLVLQLGGAHNTKSAEVFKVPLLREIII